MKKEDKQEVELLDKVKFLFQELSGIQNKEKEVVKCWNILKQIRSTAEEMLDIRNEITTTSANFVIYINQQVPPRTKHLEDLFSKREKINTHQNIEGYKTITEQIDVENETIKTCLSLMIRCMVKRQSTTIKTYIKDKTTANHFTNIKLSEEETSNLYNVLTEKQLIKDVSKEDFIFYMYDGEGDVPEKKIRWLGSAKKLAMLIYLLTKEESRPQWYIVSNIFENASGDALKSQMSRIRRNEVEYDKEKEYINNQILIDVTII